MKQLEVDQDHKYENGDSGHPIGDLTPAKFVTLLITDLGALTPAAVGHHLIQVKIIEIFGVYEILALFWMKTFQSFIFLCKNVQIVRC